MDYSNKKKKQKKNRPNIFDQEGVIQTDPYTLYKLYVNMETH